MNESKAHAVPFSPFKVIHQRPSHVAFEVDAIIDDPMNLSQMLFIIGDPAIIINFAIIQIIIDASTVLRNVYIHISILLQVVHKFIQAAGFDWPANIRLCQPHIYFFRLQHSCFWIEAVESHCVIINAKQVDRL
ncbi:hypothetical protein D3C75_1085510 [compost metagenome]